MTPTLAPQPTFLQDASLMQFSVPRYLEMVRSGILDDDDKVELLQGYVVRKMSRNPPHDIALELLQEAILAVRPTGWRIRGQSGLELPDSVPEPDLALIRKGPTRTSQNHPRPGEVGLLVEVADTSLARDTQDKPRIYARAGIVLYWVIDLVNRRVIVFTGPSGPGDDPVYAQLRNYLPGEAVRARRRHDR